VPKIRLTEPWNGDPQFLVDQAVHQLRMTEQDPDLDWLRRLSAAIMGRIADHLDAVVPFDADPATVAIPDPVTEACITALVEAYRRKEAAFGIIGAWDANGVAMRVSRDWLDPVYAALQPYRQRFGLA
jgi:hypothetical protein